MRMIRSAPSRLAASTAERPTAPSPTTATVVRGLTPPITAAWWPVRKTSDSVSSDGSRSLSSPTPALTRVPSASGTRTASACPPPTSPEFQNPPVRHAVCRPSRQKSQVLSEIANGAMTKSPMLRVVTCDPVSSTTPTNSCPIVEARSEAGFEW
jgi:hypothetical protein